MKRLDENLTNAPSCPACGLELPSHLDPNHCPRCLLRVGMESGPSAGDITVDDSHPRATGVFPKPGDLFGHYRVGRLLGERGMGAAFEAEDLPSGRRLVTMYLAAIILIVLPCLVASWLFRGDLITKMLGFNFVTRLGASAPRWRVAARNAIAWAPFLLLLPGWYWLSPMWSENFTALGLGSFCVILAILSAGLPRRGLADRLTRLWPVPR